MKRTPILLSAALLIALTAGCSLFLATPEISSFTADAAAINAGESVTFTVKGTTVDQIGYSDLVDYSGILTLTSSTAGISEEIAIDSSEAEDFEVTKTVQFSTAGTYTVTATLSTEYDYDTESITITVADPKPWDDADINEPYSISSGSWYTGYTINPTGDVDWFKFAASQSYYVIHWQDSYDYASGSSFTADVKVSVYNTDGDPIVENQDSGYDTSDAAYGAGYGIRVDAGTDYAVDEYIYIKVEGFFSSTSGSYGIYIY